MPLVPPKPEGDFEPVPAGTHVAVCTMLVDMGRQQTGWQNDDGTDKFAHQCYLRFELPEEKTDRGEPMVIGKTFTLSLHKKATLRKWLEGWRNKAFTDDELGVFDVMTVVGTGCLLSVVHRESKQGDEYATINSISALTRGMQRPTASGDLIRYGHGESGKLNQLPDWLQEKISNATADSAPTAAAHKNQTGVAAPAGEDELDDEIPF